MMTDYVKAYKQGKKEYQNRSSRGERATLLALDKMLPVKGTYTEVPLGIVQIPIDRLVGTKTETRSNAFARNFMPILDETTEFASKWQNLYISQIEEGIREPIKAYEYMNQFYVEEGNKRVSVMKYVGMVTILGDVTRIIPDKTEEKENKIYFEFLDFYEGAKINYIWFTEEGSFLKLLKEVQKEIGEIWTEDDRRKFSSIYYRFDKEYKANSGDLAHITPGDAFLSFISLYGYQNVCELSTCELKDLILKSWEEFMLLNKNQEVDVKLDPNNGKKTIFNKIMNLGSGKLKVAFIYNKTAKTSAWTYAHDLGRLHLIEKFKEDIETIFYDNITEETIEECLKRCVDEKCDVIFTTTPVFVQASVKAAIANPTVRILNCSLRTSHRYIRTYYARMYEAKFLMGIIAGVMTENKRIAYIADYPICGSIANVNAFAFGVKMVNPKAKVFVEWSSIKGFDKKKRLEELGVDIVSDKDMVIPQEKEKSYGLYRIIDDEISALAMPVWQWGEFYEQMVRTIINGTWKSDDNAAEKKAINYWWGMSAGVIDAIGSRNVPEETKKLMELFKLAIIRGEYDLFYGEIHSQDGCVHGNPDQKFSSEEIIMMNWLADNVEGYIPEDDELVEQSLPTIKLQGIEKKGN